MTLEELLMRTNSKLSIGDKWLYGDEITGEWVVLRHPYGARKNSELYRGRDLPFAIDRISEGELENEEEVKNGRDD